MKYPDLSASYMFISVVSVPRGRSPGRVFCLTKWRSEPSTASPEGDESVFSPSRRRQRNAVSESPPRRQKFTASNHSPDLHHVTNPNDHVKGSRSQDSKLNGGYSAGYQNPRARSQSDSGTKKPKGDEGFAISFEQVRYSKILKIFETFKIFNLIFA